MEKWYVVCKPKLEEVVGEVRELCAKHGIGSLEQLPSIRTFVMPYDGGKPEFEAALRQLPYISEVCRASEVEIPEKGSAQEKV